VIEPAKVAIASLVNAAGVASMILTTECLWLMHLRKKNQLTSRRWYARNDVKDIVTADKKRHHAPFLVSL
jgi:hypothetical protein